MIMNKKKMTIGLIQGVHGVRGEVKVQPLTDDPKRFFDLKEVFVEDKNKKEHLYTIEGVRLHKGLVLIKFETIDSRDESQALRQAFIKITREEAVDLEEDEFFIADLIGIKVCDSSQKTIGTVVDVIQTTGTVNNIEIRLENGKIIFVPFRDVYFKEIDVANQMILSEIPEEFYAL